MDTEQIIVFLAILLALVLFVKSGLRHDLVAMICLMSLVLAGIVPVEDAFSGFSNPAVVLVAVILVITTGLKNSGLIEMIGRRLEHLGDQFVLQLVVLCSVVLLASAFMNNVGALAVLMPVAIHLARKQNRSPSLFLMPIAFASLLGGMLTLIGTPPNIILSAFRKDRLGEAYAMFDFMPVGAGVALVGLGIIVIFARRLMPRQTSDAGVSPGFGIDEYITELLVREDSAVVGMQIRELGSSYADVQVLNVIRNKYMIHVPHPYFSLEKGDILTIEAEPEALRAFAERAGLDLLPAEEFRKQAVVNEEDVSIVEAVVMPGSDMVGQSASGMQLRNRYGINVLAISRQGASVHKRIAKVLFQVGDVLLIQGDASRMDTVLRQLGCLPLADRGYQIGRKRKLVLGTAIFVLAVAAAIFGLLDVSLAFSLAALLLVLTGIISVREIYTSIDWPVIVLLGAMLPVGMALEETGGAHTIASMMTSLDGQMPVWAILTLLYLITMLLSNVINNAATVVLMAPIALTLSVELGVAPDAFLMAVAVASSAAFLTPIGHQSNTLVMGPGGYQFADYGKLGLPVSLATMVVAIPLLLFFWPLS